MKATDQIKNLIHTLDKADGFNACIIEGAPGWGKTTAVADALVRLKIEYAHLGAYATPLGLFWFFISELRLDDIDRRYFWAFQQSADHGYIEGSNLGVSKSWSNHQMNLIVDDRKIWNSWSL